MQTQTITPFEEACAKLMEAHHHGLRSNYAIAFHDIRPATTPMQRIQVNTPQQSGTTSVLAGEPDKDASGKMVLTVLGVGHECRHRLRYSTKSLERSVLVPKLPVTRPL